MKEDTSLFKYELALTLIVKNAAPYMREWLDYHLLAGVEHFYVYDNDSSDGLADVLQPYIDNGTVDYALCPGKRPQCAAYNDAVQRRRFECRYMGFIDDDEFVLPIDRNQNIVDVLREMLDDEPDAVALTINDYNFGSSGLENADFNVPVLDRFQRRAAEMNDRPKLIVNPRFIEYVDNPHYMHLFEGKTIINTRGEPNAYIDEDEFQVTYQESSDEKLVINHYRCKSREEYLRKNERGDVFWLEPVYTAEKFDEYNANANEVVDESIVEYRDARMALEPGLVTGLESDLERHNRMFNAILSKLVSSMSSDIDPENFAGRLHEFIACRSVARGLEGVLLEPKSVSYFEELALKSMVNAIEAGSIDVWQMQLLCAELPSILRLKYPAVADVKAACIRLLPQLATHYRLQNRWHHYYRCTYLLDMLRIVP